MFLLKLQERMICNVRSTDTVFFEESAIYNAL